MYLLDQIRLSEVRASKKAAEELSAYYWSYYSELARQRKGHESEILEALNHSSISDYKFIEWQRAIKYKYGLHPLSTKGSLIDPGGRFNIGEIDPQRFPIFPALYVAKDKDTALQEILSHITTTETRLSPREIALTSAQSVTIVSVNGILEKVMDITDARKLAKFVNIIKAFKIPRYLKNWAKKLKIPDPDTIKHVKQFQENLMDNNWQQQPMLVDIPWNSQFFGQLVFHAGIEGILYKSKFTGQECLAIFINNFKNSESFIQLDHEAPSVGVPTKIDSTNWNLCNLDFNELPPKM